MKEVEKIVSYMTVAALLAAIMFVCVSIWIQFNDRLIPDNKKPVEVVCQTEGLQITTQGKRVHVHDITGCANYHFKPVYVRKKKGQEISYPERTTADTATIKITLQKNVITVLEKASNQTFIVIP